MLIVIGLAALYVRFGEIDALRRILAGVACAAVGLMIGVVFKMMAPLFKRRDVAGLLILVAAFIAIGVLRRPLPVVLLVGIPLSLGITLSCVGRRTHEFQMPTRSGRCCGPSA